MGMPVWVNSFQSSAADAAALDARSRMARGVTGDLCEAARVRGEFTGWLHQHFRVGEQRHGDMVLAVNEALANAVEFGSSPRMGRGIVAFVAAYDEDTHTLNVTVTDGGRWRLAATAPPITSGHSPRRGLGIPLMRLLADELRIDTSERGTQVSLAWTHLHLRTVTSGRSKQLFCRLICNIRDRSDLVSHDSG